MSNGNDILKDIIQRREEFNSLPLPKKIQTNREARLQTLLKTGYITPQDLERLTPSLTELPTKREDLVIAYFLMGIDDTKDLVSNLGESREYRRVISSLPEEAHSSLRAGKSLADGMSIEETEEAVANLARVRTDGKIRRAETFVNSIRGRVRKYLLKILRFQLCISLVVWTEEKEIDNIPYLRDLLKSYGYRARAKSLNETDKAAIEKAALYYLDLIELCFLNGVGMIRAEEYKNLRDEEGAFKENFYYRDIADEALLEYEVIYILFDNAVGEFYANATGKESTDFLKSMYNEMVSEEYEDADTLRGSKFAYVLEED